MNVLIYIKKWGWLFRDSTKAKSVTFLSKQVLILRIMQLWHPPPPSYPHPQKWIIDLLFKNNRICKHTTSFKTSPPPLPADVINVWTLIRSIFKNVSSGLNLLFVSVITFFKCQFSLTVLVRDVFRKLIKSLWESAFAKIFKEIYSSLFLQKSSIINIRLGSK